MYLLKWVIKLFMEISYRRFSCPLTVQQLWDAVKVIRFQKQAQDINHITNYMNKVHNVLPGKLVIFFFKFFMSNFFIF